ncbi:MAG: hypothetical protein AB1601_15795 [Planctomycetota bacterium]
MNGEAAQSGMTVVAAGPVLAGMASPARCGACGGPARVHILAGYRGGRPVEHRLCLTCADTTLGDPIEAEGIGTRTRLRPGSLVMVGGALLTLLGTSVDQFGLHGSVGLGWLQALALAGGGLMILSGALLRADVIGVAGTVLFALAIVADVRGAVGTPGFGWRQAAIVGVGVAALGIGLMWRRRAAAGADQPAEPISAGSESCNR